MRYSFFALLVLAAVSCIEPDDELETSTQSQAFQTTRTLPEFTLSCPSMGDHCTAVSDYTRFSVDMNEGDTLRLDASIIARYNFPNAYKSFVLTRMACAPGEWAEQENPTNPPASAMLSESGVNSWSGNTSDLHNTRAIFRADLPGGNRYTCWMIYGLTPKGSNAHVKFSGWLYHYSVNEYPGTNRLLSAGHRVDGSNNIHVPGGSQYWAAGTQTAADTQVVVSWMPRLTNCIPNDGDAAGCLYGFKTTSTAPGVTPVSHTDTFFDWRIAIDQYNGSQICHRFTGPWHTGVRLVYDDHHNDVNVYTQSTAIVEGLGNQRDCGNDTAQRQFKVVPQIRKTYPGSTSDIGVSGREGNTNLVIWSQ